MSQAPSKTRPCTECILVADDSVTVRTLVAEILAEQGYRVLEAQDGVQATKLYRERAGEIAVVILDEEMPLMGGHETARALLSFDPAAKVLLMSGRAFPSDEVGPGVQGFIQKPFRIADFLAQVQQLAARP